MRIALITLLFVFACQPAAATASDNVPLEQANPFGAQGNNDGGVLIPGWTCYLLKIHEDKKQILLYCAEDE